MITVRRDTERCHVQRGKHDIWHTFYPQEHPDPLADGFGNLAVFNEMRLPPGGGSRPHRRDEAEIVTYVYKGRLHRRTRQGIRA
jgi:redox-sensitive bicupin YhaK (pirin superfamily)